jgi:hypothetical protein
MNNKCALRCSERQIHQQFIHHALSIMHMHHHVKQIGPPGRCLAELVHLHLCLLAFEPQATVHLAASLALALLRSSLGQDMHTSVPEH